jgi:hypothetical protein
VFFTTVEYHEKFVGKVLDFAQDRVSFYASRTSVAFR